MTYWSAWFISSQKPGVQISRREDRAISSSSYFYYRCLYIFWRDFIGYVHLKWQSLLGEFNLILMYSPFSSLILLFVRKSILAGVTTACFGLASARQGLFHPFTFILHVHTQINSTRLFVVLRLACLLTGGLDHLIITLCSLFLTLSPTWWLVSPGLFLCLIPSCREVRQWWWGKGVRVDGNK